MSEHEDSGGRLGTVIASRFRLERLLGQGGMAAVYLAKDETGTAGNVAIKILHSEMAARKEVRERFLREGYVANQVDHPGAVKVLEHGAADRSTVFLVMELLDGDSLGDRLRHEGKLSTETVLDVLDQLLDVMTVAHDRGIVHRDIKPDNLFWTTEGKVKVLDFGLARLHDSIPTEVRTRTGIAMGTLPFMAPEQALGRRHEIDGRTDLFAIGATALKLLTNKKVHDANSEAELLMAMASKPAPPVAQVAPLIPAALAMILDRSLAFNRDARYAGAREMLEDVRAVRAGQPPPVASRLIAAESDVTRPERVAPVIPTFAPKTAVDASAPTQPGAASNQQKQETPKRRVGLILAAAFGALALLAAAAYAVSSGPSDSPTAGSNATLAAANAEPTAAPASSVGQPPTTASKPTPTAAKRTSSAGAARKPPPPESDQMSQAAAHQAAMNQAAETAQRALDAAIKQQKAPEKRRHRPRD
jgi:serine/threonine protein kinase